MKKLLLIAAGLIFAFSSVAQEYKWAFGFYGDIQAESPSYEKSFGMLGKYVLDNHSSVQAQVFGRTNHVGIGADYLYSFLNRAKNNFNIFLGAGIEQNFYWSTEEDGILRPESKSNDFEAAAQVGADYYFRPVRLSVFTAYKVKYNIKAEDTKPNYISLGIRYHLW